MGNFFKSQFTFCTIITTKQPLFSNIHTIYNRNISHFSQNKSQQPIEVPTKPCYIRQCYPTPHKETKMLNLDYVLISQFAWNALKNIGGSLAAQISDTINKAISKKVSDKLQDLLKNNKQDEFQQELSNALENNNALSKELENLRQQTQQGNHISIQIGNVTGNNNQVGNVHINQR